ncbi:response regulator [Herpetosiphon sp. NSE202]|uniref:response regulator n=1 Tax=Herpetosiphon sp. NSE202 TaxID=3351349 RepID=UPI0036322A4B
MATILAIDDSGLMQAFWVRILSRSQHTVVTVSSGDEMRAALTTLHPQLIFLDLSFPGENGFELLKQLRGYSQCLDIPVIAVSGYAGEDTRQACREAGFTDFLAKPFSLAELRGILTRYIEHPTQLRALAR